MPIFKPFTKLNKSRLNTMKCCEMKRQPEVVVCWKLHCFAVPLLNLLLVIITRDMYVAVRCGWGTCLWWLGKKIFCVLSFNQVKNDCNCMYHILISRRPKEWNNKNIMNGQYWRCGSVQPMEWVDFHVDNDRISCVARLAHKKTVFHCYYNDDHDKV